MPALEISCPAKINLALCIGNPGNSPLHPLASWMVAVNFCDTLWLEKSNDAVAQFDIQPNLHGLQDSIATKDCSSTPLLSDPPVCIDWPIDTDLTFAAHRAIQDHVDQPLTINLVLRKRIPAGAGLGGGSSNAAATLIGLNRLFDLELSDSSLIALGQQLGSDVAFLIATMLGQDSAMVTGVGEKIEPLPLTQTIHLVLIFPPFACPTSKVYAAFDTLHRDKPFPVIDPNQMRLLANNLPLANSAPRNDLAQAAFVVAPELKTLADQLRQQLQHPIHVTGSGSTLYLIAQSQTSACQMAQQITALTKLPAVATQTLSPNRAPLIQ